MKRILVYPYNYEAKWMIRNKERISDYRITSVLMNHENDVDKLTKNEFQDIVFVTNMDEINNEFDMVFLCDNVQKFDIKHYNRVLTEAKMFDKKVILGTYLLQELKKEHNVSNYMIEVLDNNTDLFHYTENRNIEIDVPVITVLGMGQNCDKFTTTLQLNDFIVERGYKPLCIFGNSIGRLLNKYIVPAFLFDENMSFTKKVLQFNYFLYQKTKEIKPDVIIMECPGGLMPINKYEHNFFSEAALVMTNAVVTDLGILNTYFFGNANNDFFEGLYDICINKFNVPIAAFGISNQQYTVMREEEKVTYRFMETDCEKIYNSVKSCKVFSVNDKQRQIEYFSDMLVELEDNIAVL